MSLQVDIKNSSSTIKSITSKEVTKLATKNQYVTDDIFIDIVDPGLDPSDATATASDILASKTAYIADGTKATGTIPTKTAVDMTVSNNTVTAPAGYYASDTSKDVPVSVLDDTIISGTAFEEATGDYAWKSTVNVPAGYHNAQTIEKTFSDVFPAPATEGTSADLRLGKQLYNHEGKLLTGTITEKSAATYTASTSDQTISSAQYLVGDQTIKAVSLNVTASNMLANTSASIESNGSTVTSVSGSIQTWNGEEYFPSLCFTANTAGSTISMAQYTTPAVTPNFQTSTDGTTWIEFIPGTTTITLTNVGDKVYFKGNNPNGLSNGNGYYYFTMTGSIAASGDIMSLIDNGQCTCRTIPSGGRCFTYLFKNCASLTTAPALPATTLAPCCYWGLFYGCTNLTTMPELPATTLPSYCYYYLFCNCTSLVNVSNLSITTVNQESCYRMFYGCTSLEVPPRLSSGTLTRVGTATFKEMFMYCTALRTVPRLYGAPWSDCYEQMFYGCTSLIISDQAGMGYSEVFCIPDTGTFEGSWSQNGMFTNCAVGSGRASDTVAGQAGQSYTYYTQNTPV